MLQSGLRGATMETIAKQAGVAKATLYSYFPDKDAIYRALVEAIAEDKRAAFHRGLDHPGPFEVRIGEALAGEFGVIADLLAGSPHADELFNAQHRFAGRLETLEDEVESVLTTLIAEQSHDDRPEMTARILLAAAYGITAKFSDPAQVRSAIRQLAAKVLGPAHKPS